MKYNKKNYNLIIGLSVISLVSILVVISLFWTPYDPNAMNYEEMLQAPSLRHIFGTDNFGRDIFVRTVAGARVTFGIAFGTILIGALIGTVIGALTGYFGGVIDEILMRVNDSLASFPGILLALVAVSLLDVGLISVCIAMGVVFIPSFARIMRAEFMEEKNKDYVLNARLMGAGHIRIMALHIFPNTVQILLSTMLVGFNNAILAEAGLSYLGLGVQPPFASIGRMLSEAQVYIFSAPWYVIFVSAFMVMFIIGITLVTENLGVSGVNIRSVKKKIEQNRKTKVSEESSVSDEIKLKLENVNVGFIEDDGIKTVVRDVSLELRKGEILGIVGESGSGKSLTSLAIMQLLPEKAAILSGNIIYDGQSLPDMKQEELCKIRGKHIAMVFQEQMTSLNPVHTIGDQLDEVLDLHESELSAGQQRQRVLEALSDVGLTDVKKLYNLYPHELSGGMRQRVMIAMALIAGADVIIADEPTTALDADVEAVILDIFKTINAKYKTSVILISHDLKVIGSICNRALVMKDGVIVEELSVIASDTADKLFSRPVTEYATKLLNAAFSKKRYVKEQKTEAGDILVLKDFSVYYRERSKIPFRKGKKKQIINSADMSVAKGSTVGIAGASGSGKSTLVKAIAGINRITEGTMERKCSVTMVFQDPYSSLNPSMKVGRLLEEPLRINTKAAAKERERRVAETLQAVGLTKDIAGRRISELSGGQRQRIAIGLTIINRSEMIILDEPVSALDVTIREQIIELLMKLKEEYGLTYILISHDKCLVERVCDKVYTIKEGCLI